VELYAVKEAVVRSVRAAKRGECEMEGRDGEDCRARWEEEEEDIRGVRAGSVRWRERVGCAVRMDAIVGCFVGMARRWVIERQQVLDWWIDCPSVLSSEGGGQGLRLYSIV
jgi:hypothetical protein